MTRNLKFISMASALALAAGASPAFAEGTTAGSTITNTVTVNYSVDSVAQTAATASDVLTVDRKVNLTVAESGGAATIVTPGGAAAVTTFVVTNTSNAALDFALSATQLADGAAAAHGGTDSFDLTGLLVRVDSNANGTYEAASDTATFIDELGADLGATVFVIGDIPLGLATDAVATIRLTATAHEDGTAAALGAAVTATAGANTAGMDTVFADADNDGVQAAEDDYKVLTAALTAAKTSLVISDPINGSTNPKMIPGAVVEYCVAVTNGGGALATNVNISDSLPAETVFEPTFGVKVNGTMTGVVCNDGPDAGAHAAGVVTGALEDLSAGETKNVKFRVTVQ